MASLSLAESPVIFESAELISFRFQVIKGGCAVLDRMTRLMWQRCSYGQHWNGDGCTGVSRRFTWDAAVTQRDGGCGFADWRLPDRDELEGLLTEEHIPAIDHLAFPNTPPSAFWTRSMSTASPGQNWSVSFGKAVAHLNDRDARMHIRLVRAHADGEAWRAEQAHPAGAPELAISSPGWP